MTMRKETAQNIELVFIVARTRFTRKNLTHDTSWDSWDSMLYMRFITASPLTGLYIAGCLVNNLSCCVCVFLCAHGLLP